jgi:hypothetical protein
MAHAKTCWLLATALTLGSIGGINAQGVTESAANPDNSAGGTATTGTGVRTGHGPLSQPIPPATNLTNPQQGSQRPGYTWGPAQTNPPEHPFGSR